MAGLKLRLSLMAAGAALAGVIGSAEAQIFLAGTHDLHYSKTRLDGVSSIHYTLFRKPIVIDASITFMKQSSLDQVRVLWTSPWGINLYYYNTISGRNYFDIVEYEARHNEQPAANVPLQWLPPGETNGQGKWTLNKNYTGPASADVEGFIQSVYKITSTELLGFIHVERSNQDMAHSLERLYAIGLALSRDGGRTWTYAGDIIRPNHDRLDDNHLSNIGGVPFTIVNEGGTDYFYVYYNETVANSSPTVPYSRTFTCVARARVSDALNDAASGRISVPWRKYNPASGHWVEPGLSGRGAGILPHTLDDNEAPFLDVHSRAAYCVPLKRHLLLANATEYHENNPSSGRLWRRLVLFSSLDGINWARKKVVDESFSTLPSFVPTYNPTYSSFVSTASGTSDDFNKVGKDFTVIYARQGRTPNDTAIDYTNASLYGRKITVVPDLTPSFTAALY